MCKLNSGYENSRWKLSTMELSSLFLFIFALLLVGGRGQDIAALKSKLEAHDRLHQMLVTEAAASPGVLHEKMLEKMSVLQNITSFFAAPDIVPFTDLTNASRNISEECLESAKRILGAKDPTTYNLPLLMKMVDATGKVGTGYFGGNLYAIGAYDECLDIVSFNYTTNRTIDDYTEYCSGPISVTITIPPYYTLPLQWLNYGMCVPRGCTPLDVALGIKALTFGEVYANASQITCVSTRKPPYNAGAILMILVCFIFALLVFAGTVFDFVFQQLQTATKIPSENIQDVDNKSETAPLLSNTRPLEKTKVRPYDFIVSFSLLKVVPQILSTKQPPSAITSINGLRVMSMFWVIVCHTHFWVLMNGADNLSRLKSVLSRFTFQAIGNAFFSVDSFFFLSGLLVAYLSMRHMKRKNGRFPFLSYYIHRYLRLTPTYAFVLFFVWLLTMHLGDGPFFSGASWEDSPLYQNCKKYWWTNLLYINNLYPWKMGDECIGWTWYLANDMQFYIFSPLILIPLYFIFPVGLAISAAVVFASFIVSGALTGVYDLQANEFAAYAYGYVTNPNISATAYQDLLYIKPWHRVAPYIIGLVLGFVLYRVRLPKKRTLFYLVISPLLLVSAICLFWTLYGLYFTWHGHIPTKAENIIYIMFSRTVWSVGLAILVFVCHYGYGGPINDFLSMKFWIPLSRVSYNAYLVHPLILTVVFGTERKVINYQDYNLAVYAVGIIVLSYGAATIVSVFVEFPIGNVEQAFFKLVGIGGRESARTGGEELREGANEELRGTTAEQDNARPPRGSESPLHRVPSHSFAETNQKAT